MLLLPWGFFHCGPALTALMVILSDSMLYASLFTWHVCHAFLFCNSSLLIHLRQLIMEYWRLIIFYACILPSFGLSITNDIYFMMLLVWPKSDHHPVQGPNIIMIYGLLPHLVWFWFSHYPEQGQVFLSKLQFFIVEEAAFFLNEICNSFLFFSS